MARIVGILAKLAGLAARTLFAGWLCVGCGALLLSQTGTTGQTSTTPAAASPPAQAFPEDPASMLAVLASKNGLDMSGAQAWHLKVSYDHFDSDGDNDSSGTYEEWWAGPRKYKRVYSADDFHRTEFATDKGLLFSGDRKWPPQVQSQVREELIDPLYTAVLDPNTKLDKFVWANAAKMQLPCVIVRRTDMIISDNGLRKYCFGSTLRAIRYTRGRGWDETVYNGIIFFQGRYVGREVQVTHAGKKYLEIRVDGLDSITQVDEADFKPSPEATAIGDTIEVEGAVISDHVLKPLSIDSRLQGSEGKFMLELLIGKDGRVKSAKAVDGPEKLRKAAEAAAEKLEFRPFLVLGAPVEVRTTWELDVHKRMVLAFPRGS